jgi:hypothetical protein
MKLPVYVTTLYLLTTTKAFVQPTPKQQQQNKAYSEATLIGINAVSLNSDDHSADANTKAVSRRKKWGVDKDHPDEYWFDHRIHTLGNHGFMGALHAAVAPLSTLIIDHAAYNGIDVRQKVRVVCAARPKVEIFL